MKTLILRAAWSVTSFAAAGCGDGGDTPSPGTRTGGTAEPGGGVLTGGGPGIGGAASAGGGNADSGTGGGDDQGNGPSSSTGDNSAAPAESARARKALRDTALTRLRAMDVSAKISGWSNTPWWPSAHYLSGEITADQYDSAPIRFNDAAGFRKVPALTANYTLAGAPCPLDVPTGALVARYFGTGETRYLTKALDIFRDIGLNERTQYRGLSSDQRVGLPLCQAFETGHAQGLLDLGVRLGDTMEALSVAAKSLDRQDGATWGRDSHQPVTRSLTDAQRSVVDPDVLYDIAGGYARSYAPGLLQNYADMRVRVLNQRAAGLSPLAWMSYVFEDHPEVAALRSRIEKGMTDFYNEAYHRDGGYLEPSLGYAYHTSRGLRVLADIPRPWASGLSTTLRNNDLQFRALALPNGGMPQIGNMVWGRQWDILTPATFAQTSIAFPFSGYYVQRSGWDSEASHLFFYYRRDARGHHMNGTNSIQLGALARPLLIGGGIPNYNGKTPENAASHDYRSWNSTYKLSTIVVDGHSQNANTRGMLRRTDGSVETAIAPPEPVQSRWHTGEHFDFVEGLHEAGYDGLSTQDVSHWRGVVFVRKLQTWIVVDIMQSPTQRDYTQIWKLAMPKFDSNGRQTEGFRPEQVVASKAGNRIYTNDTTANAVNLSLRQFGLSPDYEVYFDGDKGPYGYVGTSYFDEDAESPDVHASFSGRDQVLITILRPYRGSGQDGDGISEATDVSVDGIAGADLTIGSSTLSIRASATLSSLSAPDQSAVPAHLVVVERSGGQARTLVIGAAASSGASYEAAPGVKQPITIPKGFAWHTDGEGRWVASYD